MSYRRIEKELNDDNNDDDFIELRHVEAEPVLELPGGESQLRDFVGMEFEEWVEPEYKEDPSRKEVYITRSNVKLTKKAREFFAWMSKVKNVLGEFGEEAPPRPKPFLGTGWKEMANEEREEASRKYYDFEQRKLDYLLESLPDLPDYITSLDINGMLLAEDTLNEIAYEDFTENSLEDCGLIIRHLKEHGIITGGTEGEQKTIWYSPLEEATRSLPSQKLIPNDMLRYLRKKPGLRAELKFTGAEDFLANSRRVGREDLLEYLDKNSIKIGEVVYDSGFTKWETYQAVNGGEDYTELLLTYSPDQKIYRLVMIDPETGETELSDSYYNSEERAWKAAELMEDYYNKDIVGLQTDYSLKSIYQGPHFKEDNIVVHIRFDTHNSPVGKLLMIQEIQSDWHQRGRKMGYVDEFKEEDVKVIYHPAKVIDITRHWSSPDVSEENPIVSRELPSQEAVYRGQSKYSSRKLKDPEEFKQEAIRMMKSRLSPVGPFRDTRDWTSLAIRRMMRWAAENDYDAIGWTTGLQQLNMYSNFLASNADTIRYSIYDKPVNRTHIVGEDVETIDFVDIKIVKDGKVIRTVDQIPVNGSTDVEIGGDTYSVRLDDIVGEQISRRIRESTVSSGSVDIIEVLPKGMGMRQFYDVIVPSVADKIIKRYGVEVTKIPIEVSKRYGTMEEQVYSFPLTDEMRRDMKGKLPLY